MIYIPLYIILFILVLRLARFASTPLLRKVNFYKYYSEMFFLVPLLPNVYEIHLGTSWDFFKQKTLSHKTTLNYLVAGLVNLCNAIEKGEIRNNLKLKGNTYYLNPETASRFGFKSRNMNLLEMIMFSLNYIELCILYSVSNKKFSLVPVKNIKIIFCTAEDLLKYKSKYVSYFQRMNSATYKKSA